MEVGEKWAYRARATDPVVCVEIRRIGTARAPRVLVGFVDDKFEGQQEWVSPARLKVRWSEAEAWQAAEKRWAALQAASNHIRGTAEERAADLVLESLNGWDLAEAGYNGDAGILMIRDVDALASDVGLERTLLTGDPLAVDTGDGEWAVPWSIMRQVIERLALIHADRILAVVDADERRDRDHAMWGYTAGHGDRATYISAEICAKVSAEHGYQAARELIRRWCGQESRDRYDELRALRGEVVRLGELVERAVAAVRRGGNTREADALERELGVPVEVVRQRAAQRSSGP